MSRSTLTRFALVLAFAAVGCGGHEFEPPDRGERVREAELAYSVAIFDTIAWAPDEDRDFLGNEVYIDKCRNCHGPLGRGMTPYAQERRLEVPSLVERDWRLASLDSLHRVIYVGHEEGMPIYGAGGITPREIDAVAGYILNVLRPDVLGTGG